MNSMTPAEQLEQGLAALGIDPAGECAKQAARLRGPALQMEQNLQPDGHARTGEGRQPSPPRFADDTALCPGRKTARCWQRRRHARHPLAIALPELQVTLLDSNSKKSAFLQQAAIELALPNISVHCGRVEQYHPSFGFEAITSRAFSELADFVRLSQHLLAPGGLWLAMKGVWPHDEIARLPADVNASCCPSFVGSWR
jgi:16S rRNA (guanine527-N7)-methyltransferase